VQAQTLGAFPQPGSAGGEESARQPARGQLPQPRLPVLGVAAHPLKDHGQATGDRGYALAEQSNNHSSLLTRLHFGKRRPRAGE
jgi:hypothetical protein